MGAAVIDLPRVVPVFALSGVLLLPGARLPLTVFEPRYLALVDAALGAGRLFSLVQPVAEGGKAGPVPGLYATGTLARITAFAETGDGRILITATGSPGSGWPARSRGGTAIAGCWPNTAPMPTT
jgi:Lon protease-like protein